MDAAVHTALEEICSEAARGLHLRHLWQKLTPSLTSLGLPLSQTVKRAVWESLVEVPGLKFDCDSSKSQSDLVNCSVEECEAMNVRIVAPEGMRKSFLGVYEAEGSESSLSDTQRVILERLAVARTNGIAQSELSKELKIPANNLFYQLKRLETQGLIIRQPSVIRKKQPSNNREPNNGSIITTNMLYLYRYGQHLGCQQRLEITRSDNPLIDGEVAEHHTDIGNDDSSKEIAKENVHVKDFLPAIKAICDKLEKAQGKVLVVSDLKQDLGYRGTSGHRAWRNICHRLKDARLIEECFTMINKKEVNCLRLLKSFSPSHFESKPHGHGHNDVDTEQSIGQMKRGQVTEQVLELPILRQIYDIIDASGSKGLTNLEVCRRLGLCSKEYHRQYFKPMMSRFGLHSQRESHDKTEVYRLWTAGNLKSESANNTPATERKVVPPQEVNESNSCEDLDVHNKNLSRPMQVTDTTSPVGEANGIHESEADAAAVITEASDGKTMSNEGSGILFSQCKSQTSDANAEERQQGSISIKNNNNNMVETRSLAVVASPGRRSCHGATMKVASSQREQHILKMLEEEKFLIRPDLHKRLEGLEREKKNTVMDRKTLLRSLNKLQQEGYCKCIHLSIPGVTNCGRSRTTEVVLHPSVYSISPDILSQIHDKMRSFEAQVRKHSYIHPKKSHSSVPMLDNVQRLSNSLRRVVDQSERSEVMRTNGFVLARMVRTKLLHIFLWGWVCSSSPGWDDDEAFLLSSSNHSNDLKNPHSACKLLRLDMALKSMPLELFLQVVGSAQNFEDLVDKCRSGLLLHDLPIEEYKCLMDTRATGRLSWLIDILRRLKLIRLVSKGHTEDEAHTTLTYALELKPYIEEPVSTVAPPGFLFPDLRPQVRHDFVLSSRQAVDEYWTTLEYSYATAESRAALLAFPGSAVHEVFHSRSWASARVMTADQRAELLKILAKEDPNKKLSLRECEKIAKDLNLTLEQVLRVYHDKRQQRLTRFRRGSDAQSQENRPTTPRKRKRYSKTVKASAPGGQSTARPSLDSMIEDNDEDNDSQLHRNYAGDNADEPDDPEFNEEDKEARTFIKKCALPTNSARQRKFSWTEEADRQLVIKYARHRATLGAKFHRVDWTSISNLPAPPNTCRRRMSILKNYVPCRNAVMKLCNILAERYEKYLKKFQDKLLLNHGDSGNVMVRDYASEKDDDMHSSSSPMSEKWDNFNEIIVKVALEDVLRYKRMAKMEAAKHALSNQDNNEDSDVEFGGSKTSGKKTSSRQLPRKYTRLLKKGSNITRRMHESVAIANAAELFKLIFLSNTTAPEVPSLLAETLRRYSEHDLFAAFSYLREKKIMIGARSSKPSFVLSQRFMDYISSSPFPTDTGKRAAKFTSWLHEREKELTEEGIDVPSDLQCGEVFTLCALVSSGELLVSPCLPDEGVGEAEDKRISKRKCDSSEPDGGEIISKKSKTSFAGEGGEIISRREKGFPGIKLFLRREMISTLVAIESFKDRDTYPATSSLSNSGIELPHSDVADYLKEILDSERTTHLELDVSKSQWEAMTSYAERLMSSCSYEVKQSPIHPDSFRTIYSAIQKAGDNGLSMKEIGKILDIEDEQMLEILIEVLGSFGRALKVNAYDSIHVVDSLYRSKYFLTSVRDHAANPRVREIDDEHMPQNLDHHHKENFAAPEDEMNMNVDEVHRVTILNLPEDVADPPNEVVTEDTTMGHQHSETAPSKMNVHYGDTQTCRPLLPWMSGDGTINELVYKRIVRRVLGIVMQNPGILEDGIINQMHGLNPQSCRKLLETMTMDNHIITRKMHQMTSTQPPSILGNLLGDSFRKSKSVCRVHYFANPMSTEFL